MGMCLHCFSRIATTIVRGKVQNNFSICLDNKQQAKFEELAVTRDASLKAISGIFFKRKESLQANLAWLPI